MTFESFTAFITGQSLINQSLLASAVLIIGLIVHIVVKHYIFRALTSLIRKSSHKWDDILASKILLRRLSYIPSLIVIYFSAPLFPAAETAILKVSVALISLFAMLSIGVFLTNLGKIYSTLDLSRGKPIKGYIQVVKLIIYIAGGILIVAGLLGRSPLFALSGFGAATAVVMLIFRDTILSFVASLQITSNDLLRIGDWIEVPSFGAEGTVVDIALHTVKIENWDKTFTVVPTHKLIDESFKNWTAMLNSGGRRIKRALLIDQQSIRFCDREMTEKLKNISIIREYIEAREKDMGRPMGLSENGHVSAADTRPMTNIGAFRAYVEAYLRNHEKIRKDMTFLVRQLSPGPDGLPIEIYVFSGDTAWPNYEAIQADIFDHLLAVLPWFYLRAFQHPTGRDMRIQSGNRAHLSPPRKNPAP